MTATPTIELPYVDPSDIMAFLRPGARGRCVECDGVLLAKCGEINRWHWAHEADGSTCTGADGESAWHLAWKAWAFRQGAKNEQPDGRHRADIVWPDGRVWELQAGYLNAVDIVNRERQYGDRLTWIYRMTPGRFGRLSNVGDGWFRWKRPAPSMAWHDRPIIWHVNDRLYDTTVTFVGDEVRVRFEPGDRDRYGPVLYGSRPAPFDVNEAAEAYRLLRHPDHAQEVS